MLANKVQKNKLVEFFKTGTLRHYKRGDYIVAPGESPPGAFYIESGLVKTYDITKYGEENLLIIRKSGEIIGITWAVTGQDKHVINSALADTTCWLVSRQRFRDFITSHPDATASVIDTIVEMYRLHSERIMTLEYRTVRERLAAYLLGSADRFGEETPDGIVIKVPLKRQDIASSISATRETTSRTLSQMQQQKLINFDKSYITVIDRDRLQNIIS